MFCTNCGKQLKDGAKFCPYCGQKQKERIPLQETVKVAPEIETEVSQPEPEEESAPKPERKPAIEPISEAVKDRVESIPETEESKPDGIEAEEPPFAAEKTAVQADDTKEIRIDPVSAMPYRAEPIPEENLPQPEPQRFSCQPPLRWESAAAPTAPEEDLSAQVSDVPPKRPPWKLIGILTTVVLVVILAASIFFSIYNAPIRKFERALNSTDYATAAIYYSDGSLSSVEQANAGKMIDELVAQAVEDYNNNLASYESVTAWLDQISGSFGELESVNTAKETLSVLKTSKDYFQQAVSAEAQGDTYDAIQLYYRVSGQDSQLETAQQKAAELREKYKSEIIEQAKKLADSGDYAGACAVLQECRSLLADDEDITALIEEYSGENRKGDIADSLKQAEEHAKKGDYLAAINLLKKTDEQYKADSQVTAKLAEYKQRYKEQVIKEANGAADNSDCAKGYELLTGAKTVLGADLDQAISDFKKLWEEKALAYAETLAGQSKYEDAVDTLNTVMGKIGETDSLKKAAEEYKKKCPVSLLDMEPVSGEIQKNDAYDSNLVEYTDIYGNTSTEYASIFSDSDHSSIEFLTDGNYSTFSGRIIIGKESEGIGMIRVYADNKEVYTSKEFDKKTEPIDLNINIAGAKFVKIFFDPHAHSNYLDWERCRFAISDPVFHN